MLLLQKVADGPGGRRGARDTSSLTAEQQQRLELVETLASDQETLLQRLDALEVQLRKEGGGKPGHRDAPSKASLDALTTRLDELELAVVEAAGAVERVAALEAENQDLRRRLDELHMHTLELIPAQAEELESRLTTLIDRKIREATGRKVSDGLGWL